MTGSSAEGAGQTDAAGVNAGTKPGGEAVIALKFMPAYIEFGEVLRFSYTLLAEVPVTACC